MNSNFLKDFETSLQSLSKINDYITKSIEDKTIFSKNVYQKLIDINEKIQGLSEGIGKLKQRLADLQKTVDTNEQTVNTKTTTCNDLANQLQSLQQEKADLANQLELLRQKYDTDINGKQDNIDKLESDLRELNEQHKLLQTELETLKQYVNSKGDNHANDIANQEAKFEDQIKKLMAENEEKQKALEKSIQDKEQTITDLNNKLTAATQEAQANKANLDNQSNETQNQINNLQSEIARLQALNDDYVSRIISATQAINEAVNNLSKLTNDSLNSENITKAFTDIELSIQKIANAMNSNSSNSSSSSNSSTNGFLPQENTAKINNRKFTILGKEITLDQLVTFIKQNYDEADTNIASVLRQINGIITVYGNNTKNIKPMDISKIERQIIDALNQTGIDISDLTGGFRRKKTRKLRKHFKRIHRKSRKQKGGYIYNNNAKRIPIKTL